MRVAKSPQKDSWDSFLSAVPVPMALVDKSGVFMACSAGWENAFPVWLAEMEVGKSVLDKAQDQSVKGDYTAGVLAGLLINVLAHGRECAEQVVKVKSNTIRIIVCVASNLNTVAATITIVAEPTIIEVPENGGAASVEGTRDTLFSLFENAPFDMVVLTPAGQYIYVNPSAVKDPVVRHWMIGKSIDEYNEFRDVDPEFARRRNVSFADSVRRGGAVTLFETLIDRLGNTRNFERHYRPAKDKSGKVILVFIYGIEVTENKQLELDLILSQSKAIELQSLQNEFLTSITHEVRTPLACIQNLVQIIAEEYYIVDVELVEMLVINSKRLQRLMDNLIVLSRQKAQKQVLNTVHSKALNIITGTIDLFKSEAEEKNLSLTFNSVLTDEFAVFDPQAFHHCLVNVLSNAIKFTSEGGVRVLVSNYENLLTIKVIDTGVGMEPDFVMKSMNAFTQESTGLARMYQGAGIGLTTTYKLIKKMGGKLIIKSTLGVGTTVTLQLNRRRQNK